MVVKVVDCFQGRTLLYSYPVSHSGSGSPPKPPTDADFIKSAKRKLVSDGLDPGDIELLTLTVRPG